MSQLPRIDASSALDANIVISPDEAMLATASRARRFEKSMSPDPRSEAEDFSTCPAALMSPEPAISTENELPLTPSIEESPDPLTLNLCKLGTEIVTTTG